MIDAEQKRIDRGLQQLHEELSGFVFTASRNWKRSLIVNAETRGLLCFAIRELQLKRANNRARAEEKST